MPCSGRYVEVSNGSLTGASTAASMTPSRRWQLSAPPWEGKWTWTSCASSCWLSCSRRCSPHTSRCGCVHWNTMKHIIFLGESILLFAQRMDEAMKGDGYDGNQSAHLCADCCDFA